MRNILLATTALVGAALFAAPASAGDLKIEMGGYTDFQAGFFDDNDVNNSTDKDFKTEFKLGVDVMGKGAGDLEYGARIELWNGDNYTSASAGTSANNTDGVNLDQAYVFLGGNWGKVMLGDTHGASDMLVYAPVVATGGIDGDYTDFVGSSTLAPITPHFINDLENSTKAVYYTPSLNGFQLGVSYTPEFDDAGKSVINIETENRYRDVFEVGATYNGTFNNVGVSLSGLVTSADTDSTTHQDFTAWALGAQVNYAGFTVGGSYYDAGDYNMLIAQDDDQSVWTLGGKYAFGAAELGVQYLDAEGYNGTNYVDSYQAVGFGASYNWFPGLVSAVDVVLFDQEGQSSTIDTDGTVVILSQRVNF